MALVALAGCQVTTQVSVDAANGGRGVVGVSVSLDRSALGAVGGSAALAAQLQVADLTAAGWTVTGPSPGPGGTTVVAASHPYTTPTQASALVREIAGAKPFQLAISSRHTFWRTETTLTGKVDLTCGLACFGDSGLAGVLGSPTGVNPGPLAGAAGQQPAQVFTFGVAAHLPGGVVRSNAGSRSGGNLQWTPRLGQSLTLTAVTRQWDSGRIVAAIVAGGVVVLVLFGLGAFWWRRRRRRRGPGRGRQRRGAHRQGAPTMAETVTPHP